jgi:hypothetical protein
MGNMSRESGARAGSASVAIATAVLTVVALTFVLVLSSVGGNTLNTNVGAHMNGLKQPNAVTAPLAAPSAAAGLNSSAAASCVTPPLPTQILAQVGTPPFTLVGASTACTVVVASQAGANSLASVPLTLSVTKPIRMYMVIDVNNNGTSSVPNGTSFTVTYGTRSFAVQDDLFNAQTPKTVIALSTGEAAFHIEASVPNPYKVGIYSFSVAIFASYEDNGGTVAYSDWIPVNLDAR